MRLVIVIIIAVLAAHGLEIFLRVLSPGMPEFLKGVLCMAATTGCVLFLALFDASEIINGRKERE